MISKEKFLEKFNKLLDEKITDIKLNEFIRNYAYEKHNIEKGRINSIMIMRIDSSEAKEIELFAIVEAMLECKNVSVKRRANELFDFFTDKEKENYSDLVLDDNKIKSKTFDIPGIQLNENQWLGVMSMRNLMMLRDSSIINYNENTQRALKRIVRGEDVVYTTQVNKRAVNEIKECMKNDAFIPNLLTLNIQPSVGSRPICENGRIKFTRISRFDIIDGYHRYLAISQNNIEDEDFSIDMGVMITYFSEPKAQDFIYQEDKKTRLVRFDAESLNNNSRANIICDNLNETCRNFKGQIGRNDEIINKSDLNKLISYFYISPIGISKFNKSKSLEVENEIKDKLNLLADSNYKLLDEQLSFTELLICFIWFKEERDIEYLASKLKEMKTYVDEDEKFILTHSSRISKYKVFDIKTILKRGGYYD